MSGPPPWTSSKPSPCRRAIHSGEWRTSISTPHCGIVLTWDDYVAGAIKVFLDNLERFMRGETLVNVTDPVRGY